MRHYASTVCAIDLCLSQSSFVKMAEPIKLFFWHGDFPRLMLHCALVVTYSNTVFVAENHLHFVIGRHVACKHLLNVYGFRVRVYNIK